jgi:hypothetical protein
MTTETSPFPALRTAIQNFADMARYASPSAQYASLAERLIETLERIEKAGKLVTKSVVE